MRYKVSIVVIIISVFVLGVLIANYNKSRSANSAESETPAQNVSESVQEDADEQSLPKETDDADSEAEKAEPDGSMSSMDDEVSEADGEEPGESEPEKIPLPKYDELLPVNPYVAGWLTIDGSRIDDPVVYTPKSQNYFLHRAIDGSNESRGTLFIAINWQEGYNNTLIYGHNMKDGSGFGSLAEFAKESYGREHPLIRFDTLYEEREYELYAAFYSQIDEEELETEEDRESKDQKLESEAVAKKEEQGESVSPAELTLNDIDLHRDFGDVDIYREEKDEDNGGFRYYYYTDLSDEADFDYYAENVKARALYDTGVDAKWGDEFITLSTCSYQVKNGRFVVVGVRKKE